MAAGVSWLLPWCGLVRVPPRAARVYGDGRLAGLHGHHGLSLSVITKLRYILSVIVYSSVPWLGVLVCGGRRAAFGAPF